MCVLSCIVWVCNLVCHLMGRRRPRVFENGDVEVEETAQWGALWHLHQLLVWQGSIISMAEFRYSGIWCSLVTSSPVTGMAGFHYSGIWCSLVTSSPITGMAGFRYSGIWCNLNVLPSSSRISKFWKYEVIKLRRIRWAGHVAGMVDVRNLLTVRLENIHQLEIVDLNRRILLKWF